MARLTKIALVTLPALTLGLFGCADDASSGSRVGGLISAAVVWDGDQCPVVMEETVVVAGPEASLRIGAGCEVRVPAGASLVVGGDSDPGTLIVEGSVEAPVRFVPADGSAWGGVFLMATASEDSRLSNMVIEGAGAGRVGAALVVDHGVARVSGVEVRESVADGVLFVGGAVFAEGASLDSYDNAGHPLVIDAAAVPSIPEGRWEGNGTPLIGVRGGTLEASARWEDRGLPYAIYSDLVVAGDDAPTLIIGAGVELSFAWAAGMRVGTGALGALRLEGTEERPVHLSALNPRAGWGGLLFADATVDRDTALLHAEITDARSPFYQACVTINHANPTLKSVTIDGCEGEGIALDEKSAFGLGSERLTVRHASRIGVLLYAEAVRTLPIDDSVYADNGLTGILVAGGRVTISGTWRKADQPYIVEGDIHVGGHRKPVLTIEPGVELQFGPDVGLYIGDSEEPGGLVAAGTLDEPVRFTSREEARKGEWSGICFGPETRPNHALLERVEIEWAGGAFLEGSVVAEEVKPIIRDSLIVRGLDCGVYARCSESGPPVLHGNDFGDGSDINEGGALCLDGCAPF